MNYIYIPENIENMVIEHIERSNDDGTVSWIPLDILNSDYQMYLKWLEENNG